MPVEGRPQSLLVQVVTNETDTSSKNEERVESTDLHVFFSLFRVESARRPEKINEGDSNATIDVENEGVLLG